MSMTALQTPLRSGRLDRHHATVLTIFTATLFLSALLLFSVQPVFAKMVLPQLGGAPSVWAVSLCFFQAALLAGYAYAHALNRYAGRHAAPVVHLGLLGIAALALPFGLPAGTVPPEGDAYFWLLGVLTVGVGLPFFAVSANAPLLQAWFARSGHPHGRDPYFLYGASNLGSLIALLAYPVLIEPALGLADQASVWSGGFLLLAAGIALCSAAMIAGSRGVTADIAGVVATSEASAEPVTWTRIASWIGFAFVPSSLLVAFTGYVATDIASAPFLWVTPLAIFLLTFVLVFRERPLVSMKWLLLAQPVLFALVIATIVTPSPQNLWTLALLHTPLFVVTTLVAHKQLYDARPHSAHLTQFYLWMSFGGVLGGVFAAIVAPQVFSSIYEYPLLLLAGFACRPDVLSALRDRAARTRAVPVAAKLAALFALFMVIASLATVKTQFAVSGVMFVVAGMFLLADRAQALNGFVYATALALTVTVLPSAINNGQSERSFFGVVRVSESEDGALNVLRHGTTVHGAVRMDQLRAGPDVKPQALTYYYAGSPMRLAAEAARVSTGKSDGGFVAGVVGLGAGSLACEAKAGETWRFYEIDPVIVRVARDASRFPFLSRCLPDNDIVVGDARLTVSREPAGKFDYLLIDAFSSDSVPVHLMTREAIQSFLDKVSTNGLVAMHVSNRYMALEDVAAATALAVPGTHVAFVSGKPKRVSIEQAASSIVVLAKNAGALAPVLALDGARAVTWSTATPWTDDYSNVVMAIWRRLTGAR